MRDEHGDEDEDLFKPGEFIALVIAIVATVMIVVAMVLLARGQ